MQPSSNWTQPSRHRQKPSLEQASHTALDLSDRKDRRGSLGADSSTAPLSSSTSSSQSNSDADGPVKHSQLFKRPPRFRSQRARENLSYDGDLDDPDDQGHGTSAALPFATAAGPTKLRSNVIGSHRPTFSPSSSKAQRDKKAGALRDTKFSSHDTKSDNPSSGVEATSSMTSSASDAPKSGPRSPGPFTSNHRAELARLSPRKASLKARRDGSEGTPSMGSSFSDLDGMN